jgi:hypothetical protein
MYTTLHVVMQDDSLGYVVGALFTVAATRNRQHKSLGSRANKLLMMYIIDYFKIFLIAGHVQE